MTGSLAVTVPSNGNPVWIDPDGRLRVGFYSLGDLVAREVNQ